MTVFKREASLSLTESVKQELLGKILSGELKPGDKLQPERELSAKMGVSRSSLHQAILQLEGQGFLSVLARQGTIVSDYRKHPTPQSLEALMSYGSVELDYSMFRDMMDTRIWLESECARRACDNIYDTTLQEMRAIIDDIEKADGELSELVYSFHYMLTQASGNSIYTMIFRGFDAAIRSLIRQHYQIRSADIAESVRLRRTLLDAIERRDKEAAAAIVTRIIVQGVNVLEEKYT